jgi:hypothetical protein
MAGVAANDATERDRRIIRSSALGRGIERDHDRRGDFERTRHRQHVATDPCLFEGGKRASQQRIGNMGIEARLDDEAARAFEAGTIFRPTAGLALHRITRSFRPCSSEGRFT